ncbi:unnamed protein product [Symbiodinium sp. CCMP2456]|nr:unnamed protein product [Symbiodinium sp. CCMP2456]
MDEAPKLGVYIGSARDVTCPGDHVTYEFVLYDTRRCTLECIPQLNFFEGGQPPWRCEGNYEVEDGEIVMEVTKQDVRGPRRDTDVRLEMPAGSSGSEFLFRNSRLGWVGPPPALPSQDPVKLKKAQLQKEEEEAAKRKTELEAQREELDRERLRQEEQANREKAHSGYGCGMMRLAAGCGQACGRCSWNSCGRTALAASGICARLHRCGLAGLDEELRQQQAAQEARSRDCTATAFASKSPGQPPKDGASQAEAAQRREELERQKEELRRMEEARWGKLWVVRSVGASIDALHGGEASIAGKTLGGGDSEAGSSFGIISCGLDTGSCLEEQQRREDSERESQRVQEELRRQREELKALEEERQELAQREEQEMQRRKQEGEQETQRLAAEAEKQRAELQRRREELQAVEAAREEALAKKMEEEQRFSAELQRWAEQQQEALRQQREELRALEAEREEILHRKLEEQQKLREDEEAEAQRAAEARRQRAAEAASAEAEIQRKREELEALEAETDSARRQKEDEERRLEQEQAANRCKSPVSRHRNMISRLVCLNLLAVRTRSERWHLFSEATPDQHWKPGMLLPDHILDLDRTRPGRSHVPQTLTFLESISHACATCHKQS